MTSLPTLARAAFAATLLTTFAAPVSLAQQATPRRPATPGTEDRARRPVKINQARAESLYVSTDPEDHPPRNFERDMDVPAYLFTPLAKRGARGHAAMVWVHGGVHGDWNEAMLPFVKEAVQR